jgi:hypothetical protein
MKRLSALDRELTELKISELPSLAHVEAKQKEMLRLLRRFAIDPVSYVGLDHCGTDHCGRVNCSEACWFGTLRRRVTEVLAIRRLMKQHERPLYRIIAWKPDWGCPSGWLHYITPGTAKALMTRVFNSMCSMSVTAVGTFNMVAVGMNANQYHAELHVIVGGATKEELESAFRPVQPDASVRISKVDDTNRVIDEVITRNSPRRWEPLDDPPEPAQLAEFYAWLAEMKIGARIFRYGCDENFELITYREIRFKPRLKKNRPGRRRYRKRRKKTAWRPWSDWSYLHEDEAYYNDEE